MKPSAIKKLEGNRGNRPINDGPNYQRLDAEPPDFLSLRAKEEWHRVYPLLSANQIASEADQWVLAVYCQSYAEYIDHTKLLSEEGEIIETPHHGQKKNPRTTLRQQAFQTLSTTAQQLGFSPLARQKILTSTDKGDAMDSLAEDMRGVY